MEIPNEIDQDEIIVRNVFYPFGINEKNKITYPCITPPAGSNEISVLRLNYTSENICIEHGKSQESEKKKFRGFLKFKASDITLVGLNIKATPLENLPFHADIIYSFVKIKGSPLSPQEIKQMNNLLDKAIFEKYE